MAHRHGTTRRNLHVLVVIEEGKQVHTGAYPTHTDMIQGWKNFIIEISTPETALDEELRRLADMDSEPDISEVVDSLSTLDIIEWWLGSSKDGLNEARFYEVQDRT
jgi:hypothetical protein